MPDMLQHFKSHSKASKSLSEWLCYLETIHNKEIDLGLTRINQVAQRLAISFSFARVITVAGTNGKGTTCAFLENALLKERYNEKLLTVAVYSSPHIECFNERLRINKTDVTDHAFITAFEKIEQARGDISLSYYEFTTLAAFLILMTIKPDVIILEVGLGGRLDATNIIDADIAVITSIDIDHQVFLGDNRESIGFEKAGIMRANQDIIIGDINTPKSVLNHANKVNDMLIDEAHQQAMAKIKVRDQHFSIEESNVSVNSANWHWYSKNNSHNKSNNVKGEFHLHNLINPNIPRDNVATALMVLKQLGVELNTSKVNALIEKTKVAGRTELFLGDCDVLLDVGHNPHAGRYLAKKLSELKLQNNYQRIIAVVAMLADKDINNTLAPLANSIDEWYVAPLTASKSASAQLMANTLKNFTNSINCFDNVTQAFKIASQNAEATDLILVFGSFFTVAEIRRLLT